MTAAYGLGFQTLTEEVTDRRLSVEGEVPAWLDGTLLRNGPARFEIGGERVAHWFDGLAMLRRFAFDDGGVRYSNRYLRSEAYRDAVEDGTVSDEFASSSSGLLSRLRSLVVPEPTDNANVHVARLAGRYVALTETPRMVAFDPDTLETRETFAFDDDVSGQMNVAHVHHDERAGETVGLATKFGRRHAYNVYRVEDGATRRELVGSIPVDEPAYLHSFALTPNYVVVVECPFVVNPLRFLRPGGGAFIEHYEWKPDRGTRFFVMNRRAGEVVADPRTDAFFTFHQVNAFERDGEVVVDLVAFPDADLVSGLYLDELDGQAPDAPGELRRYRLRTTDWRVEGETVHPGGMELPRVSPAVETRPYRYAYAQGTTVDRGNTLFKVDVETGDATEWGDDGLFCLEPVFVPRQAGGPDDRAESPPDGEDDGVVLVVALDVDAGRSVLVVLDGETFTELARAPLPHHLPFGFHGRYFPEL